MTNKESQFKADQREMRRCRGRRVMRSHMHMRCKRKCLTGPLNHCFRSVMFDPLFFRGAHIPASLDTDRCERLVCCFCTTTVCVCICIPLTVRLCIQRCAETRQTYAPIWDLFTSLCVSQPYAFFVSVINELRHSKTIDSLACGTATPPYVRDRPAPTLFTLKNETTPQSGILILASAAKL
jgi:hypothetical protein